jgi:heptosyltransferase-2
MLSFIYNSFAQMKILVVRFSSIGDIVLTSPVTRALKLQSEAEVHYLTKEKFAFLLSDNPYVDKVWTLKEELSELIPALKAENFDEIIDLHNNLRTHFLSQKLGIPCSRFKKLNIQKMWYVWTKQNRLPDVHIVDRYLDACGHLGIQNDGKGLDYFLPEGMVSAMETLPAPWKNGFYAVVIGGQHSGKVMPTDKWINVLSKVEEPVVLLGGPEDMESGSMIQKGAGEHVYNACGMFDLNASASLVRDARFVLSHDTGLMHIAAAFKKDVISIWGATVPEFGMYPYMPGPHSKCLQPEDYAGLPYSKLGDRKWYKGPFKGWDYLDEERIIRAIKDQRALSTR